MVLIDKKIESTFEAVHKFVEDVLKKIRFLEFNEIEGLSFKINIMLREILNNAVEHGNEFDENKSIDCKIEYNNSGFTFTVTDEGDGYKLSEFYSIRKGFTLKHRSRGLELIKKYDFQYDFDGSTIIVKYKFEKE